MASSHKIAALEVVRLLAALSIIIWHFQFYFAKETARADLPWSNALYLFYNYGYSAVPWFWVLSGYVLFYTYRSAIEENRISGKQFFFRRLARLYPLHFVTLILVAALQLTYLSQGHEEPFKYVVSLPAFSSQLFMASNWFTRKSSFNGPIWSVSVEVLVYAFFFIASWLNANIVRIASVCGASLVAYDVLFHSSFAAGAQIAACLLCFYLGGAAYELNERHRQIVTNAAVWAFLIAVATLALIFRPVYFISFVLPALGILATANVRTERFGWLGNATYGSYLFHFPLALTAVIGFGMAGTSPIEAIKPELLLVFFAAASLGLGALSYVLFEVPTKRWLLSRLTAKPAMA